MDILAQLGVALGLASLSGVNLYLTVLITGLAVRFDWVHLASQHQSLEVLGHPLVLIVAGLLFSLQFVADKIPWVDSLWDSVHTVIRPVGAVLVALEALGSVPGYIKVIAALLAGGAAFTTHSAKAGTRLLINHSPEPVTNIAMSLGEDVAVTGGVILTLVNPVVALMVFSGLIALIWILYPRLWRLIRSTLWLAWHKLKLPGRRADAMKAVELKADLDDALRDLLLIRAGLSGDEVSWTVRCLSGRAKGVRGLCANLDGVLLAPTRPDCVYFAASRALRSRLFKIPLHETRFEVESRFLSENLMIQGGGVRAVFRFPRGQGDIVEEVARRLTESLAKKTPSAEGSLVPAGDTSVPDEFEGSPVAPGVNPGAPAEGEGENKLAPLPVIG